MSKISRSGPAPSGQAPARVLRKTAWAAAAAALVAGAALAWTTRAREPAYPVAGARITHDGAVVGTRAGKPVILRRGSTIPVGGADGARARVFGASPSGNVITAYWDGYGVHGFVRMRSGAIHRLPRNFAPVAVNDSGVVAGHVHDEPTRIRSAVWRPGKPLAVIPDHPDRPFHALAINSHGDVVGQLPPSEGALWSRGVLVQLPLRLRRAYSDLQPPNASINDRGEVLGMALDEQGREQPAIWHRGRLRYLPRPRTAQPGAYMDVAAINNRGEVAGWIGLRDAVADTPVSVPLLWREGGPTLLPNLPGAGACIPWALNDAGTVMGACGLRTPWRPGNGSERAHLSVLWEDGAVRPVCGGGRPTARAEFVDLCDPATYQRREPPHVLSVRIHPALPVYRLLLTLREEGPVAVRIYAGDLVRPLQELEIPESGDRSNPIHLLDVNFDGYQDLEISEQTGYALARYYLFNPSTGRFDWLMDDQHQLTPDSARRELSTYVQVGAEYQRDTYRWGGTELVRVRTDVTPHGSPPRKSAGTWGWLRNGRVVEAPPPAKAED